MAHVRALERGVVESAHAYEQDALDANPPPPTYLIPCHRRYYVSGVFGIGRPAGSTMSLKGHGEEFKARLPGRPGLFHSNKSPAFLVSEGAALLSGVEF